MAILVSEVMNPELFSVRGEEEVRRVEHQLLTLGITAAPVLDGELRPIGVVSLRDLARARGSAPALPEMTPSPTTVSLNASVQSAAEAMADGNHRHVIVVDGDGRAVGFLSALDVVRGLIGRPRRHPDGFPRYDPRSGLAWSNPAVLDMAAAEQAPATPGVVRLLRGGAGEREVPVWAEVTGDVRAWLVDIAHNGTLPAELVAIRERGNLRFQLATLPEALPPHRSSGGR